MSTFSFRVYIDESGDEGFVFKPDNQGSSRWLILSAVVLRKSQDVDIVNLMRGIRAKLRRNPKQALHFYKMEHAQSVVYARMVGEATPLLHTVSVLIHKPSISDPETFASQKHSLYRHASRLLLERVSWFCREHHKPDEGNGTAEFIFSNRDQMSYDELRDYLRHLRDGPDREQTSIDWAVVNPDHVRAVQHEQMAGLQIADAVAHSLYDAASPNRFGDTEDKYARLILPTLYRHKGGKAIGYGLKFWPDDLLKLKTANPHLAVFAEETES